MINMVNHMPLLLSHSNADCLDSIYLLASTPLIPFLISTIHRFRTGTFLSKYPNHLGLVLRYSVSFIKSSTALAHLTSASSLHALCMKANPNGIPVSLFTPAGTVIIGYPACAAIWYV